MKFIGIIQHHWNKVEIPYSMDRIVKTYFLFLFRKYISTKYMTADKEISII